ncbi:hypothetical protein B0H12DRAFT_1239507 [Mycena haematopus]|nr:hypothetical protein B0H12DRAFT_1239507 [Mycena haematopus]
MSFLAAVRKFKPTATSTAVLHTSTPSPARSPVVVRPGLTPLCSESVTIQHWGGELPLQCAVYPTAILHTSTPSPARSPVVVRPALPSLFSESATIRHWDGEPSMQCSALPHMQRGATEGPRPLLPGVAMKTNVTERDAVEAKEIKDSAAAKEGTLVRSRAIRRSGRKGRGSTCS